jgi:quercetin dioxygenase-like cupin family protein
MDEIGHKSILDAAMGRSVVGREVRVLLKTNQTADGGRLRYPVTDKPELSSSIVTIQPGGHTNIHRHPVVTFVYVLEGEIEFLMDEKEILHYKAGDAFVEPIDSPNQGFNRGRVPTKVLLVQVGEEGKPNSIAAG